MGETRVDLLHLLEDLADAYPGDLHETVLTEIVANALDSGAARLHIIADAPSQSVTLIDDGVGMNRADLRRYHDVATSTKERGQGIGFAGVGIKLGLLVSEEVITESRRGNTHISTTWSLASRKRAPWQWIPPLGLVAERGTAIRLRMSDVLSPLLDAGFLEATLRRHFEPLLDPSFDDILRPHYPNGVTFQVNDRVLERAAPAAAIIEPVSLRLARKRKPSAMGYVIQEPSSVADDRRGIAISTYGKVIKRGWDWLGITPAVADRASGLIEVPALAGALTLNKADFLRSGPRGALFLAYRKALQEAVSLQLARWSDSDSPAAPAARESCRLVGPRSGAASLRTRSISLRRPPRYPSPSRRRRSLRTRSKPPSRSRIARVRRRLSASRRESNGTATSRSECPRSAGLAGRLGSDSTSSSSHAPMTPSWAGWSTRRFG